MINLNHSSFKFSKVSHVIFDKDGTITDSNIYWGEIIKRRSLAIQQFYSLQPSYIPLLEECLGLKGDRLLAKGPIAIKSRSEVLKILSDYLSKKGLEVTQFELAKIFDDVHSKFTSDSVNYIKPIAPSIELLDLLVRHDVCISLATSDSLENTLLTLKVLDLKDMFKENIICRDSGYQDKVTGMPALELCRRTSCRPTETIAIGDSIMDLTMSNASGLKGALLVASGQVSYSDLKTRHKQCCSSLSEITISS